MSSQSFSCEGYRLLGRADEAIARHLKFWNRPGPVAALIDRRRLKEAEPFILSDLAQNPNGPYQIGARALSSALRGKYAEAEALIPRTMTLRKNPSYHHATHDFAAMYALQGKAHLAVKWLRETVRRGCQATYCSRVTRTSTPFERIQPSFSSWTSCGSAGKAISASSISRLQDQPRASWAIKRTASSPQGLGVGCLRRSCNDLRVTVRNRCYYVL